MKRKFSFISFFLIGLLICSCDKNDKTNSTIQNKPEQKQNIVNMPSVKIGNQIWSTENLNVIHYRNGDVIPQVKSSSEWEQCYQNEEGAWCYYDNDSTKAKKYGKLYNWYAVNDKRGLAPEGWHIPTNEEWQTLISSLGGQNVAFSKLKSWSGFSAIAAGERYYQDCSFYKIDEISFWWTSTKEDNYNAWYHAMHFGYEQVASDNGGMNTGFSVRCIKN